MKVSSDGGTTFTQAEPVTPEFYDYIGTNDVWSSSLRTWWPFVIDLSPWAGQQVIVRFENFSNGSVTMPGLYVDNLVVGD